MIEAQILLCVAESFRVIERQHALERVGQVADRFRLATLEVLQVSDVQETSRDTTLVVQVVRGCEGALRHGE
ncbi:MAG TPA: hypothetical protein EYQ27_16825 [Gemmatimonadetes bacterium]|nr:hypothetical protein [Gemmatimonadota bacterium]